MVSGEEAEVSDTIARVFHEFVAHEYPPKGIEEFFDYIQPQALKERAGGGHFILVAKNDGKIVGMIQLALVGFDNISMGIHQDQIRLFLNDAAEELNIIF